MRRNSDSNATIVLDDLPEAPYTRAGVEGWHGWFICCRSVWLPGNDLLVLTSVCGGTAGFAFTRAWFCEWSWPLTSLLCTCFTWLVQWVLLWSARDLEAHNYKMASEIIQDRSLMPLGLCSIPASVLAGTAWFTIVHGAPAVLQAVRGTGSVT